MDGSVNVAILENGRVKVTVEPSGSWFDMDPDMAAEVAAMLAEKAEIARETDGAETDGGRF